MPIPSLVPKSFAARCGLAIVSGALYASAYPPLGWRWMILPGIVGLLLSVGNDTGTRARAIGFLHGLAAYGIGLSWLFRVFGPVALMLFVVLASFTALFAHLQGCARSKGLGGWWLAAFTALNWGGWEFIRAECFPLKFPWMTPGLALGPGHLIPWIGVYSVGVIFLFATSLLVIGKWRWAAGIFAALITTGIPVPPTPPASNDPLAVKASGIQSEGVALNHFLDATEQLPQDVRYVVWPEYAVPFDLQQNPRNFELVRKLCEERNITLTLGTQSRPEKGENWRNIALTLDGDGVRCEHNKVHTVHFFNDGVAGKSALPIKTAYGKIGTPVCFDCDYEGIVRKMTTAGAEMFMVPIMDAESWSVEEHKQHAELFRIRARENARWLFVCSTSGVSQIIDPLGNVVSRLTGPEPGTLTGVMRRETRLTFYTRAGWIIPWAVLALAICAWIAVLLPRRRPTPT